MTTATRTRPVPVDLDRFAETVNRALDAFTGDVCYAEAIAQAAVSINRKRATFAARRTLRAAETAAHAECRRAGPFVCDAQAACGTGDCKFATGTHAALSAPAEQGTHRRPQPHSGGQHGAYSLEQAVAALADRELAKL